MRRALAALSAVIVLGAAASFPVAASADTAPRAAKGDCLSVTDITSVTSAAESVACSQSHNAEIFRIGTAPESTGLPSQAFVTAQQLNTMCTASEATTALAEALDHLGIKGATILPDVLDAATAIAPHIQRTPLISADHFPGSAAA
ncbi:MAG: septum formation family protein, partial [Actinomycetota bacterium]